jgi:GNAT superfamily N-acetyltransferase
MSFAELEYERAAQRHADGLLELFESAGSGCFCNYWHFEGDKNAWLERCYLHPEQNRAALVARLEAPSLCGVVARSGTSIAGWMKLEPAQAMARLYAQRVYKSLPCLARDPAGIYTIGCFFVLESRRGEGIARSLLRAGIELARHGGGKALEAFPRALAPEAERVRADQAWLGPESLYIEAGFARVSEPRAYPVLRLDLAR